MSDCSILVTGASRGLGLQLARALAQRGDRVVGVSRGAAGFEHEAYEHHSVDVSDEDAVRNFWHGLANSGRRISTLVNNAGISAAQPALLMKASDFNKVMRTNASGAFVMSREALRHMRRNRFGRIISMSSINVPLCSAGAVAYNASKAAVEALSRTLVNEIAATEDITVNCLGISLVADSGMVDSLTKKAMADKTARLPRPELLSVEEILHAIDFLRGSHARNISGQTIYYGGIR